MRITRVSTTIVHAEMRNWIFVRVDTDSDGLYGWGEATCEWKTRAVAGAIGDLEPLVIGRDPRDIEQLVRAMKKHSFWKLGIIGMSARVHVGVIPMPRKPMPSGRATSLTCARCAISSLQV